MDGRIAKRIIVGDFLCGTTNSVYRVPQCTKEVRLLLRLVCKKFSHLITQHGPFWPNGGLKIFYLFLKAFYSYAKMMHNLATKKIDKISPYGYLGKCKTKFCAHEMEAILCFPESGNLLTVFNTLLTNCRSSMAKPFQR